MFLAFALSFRNYRTFLDFYIDLIGLGIEFARLMEGSIPVYPIEVLVNFTLIAYAELRWIVVLSHSCETLG